ncbi:putative cytoplasmic protein [Salmonella enterica subsp. enterica]|nr:putative cytoplasmic protein [Salmonella enterica subsp. enterica]
MTAGKRRELHALETELETISHSEPAQLLEEERLRREIAELRAKIERVPFIDTLIYAIKIMKNGLSPPARR